MHFFASFAEKYVEFDYVIFVRTAKACGIVFRRDWKSILIVVLHFN